MSLFDDAVASTMNAAAITVTVHLIYIRVDMSPCQRRRGESIECTVTVIGGARRLLQPAAGRIHLSRTRLGDPVVTKDRAMRRLRRRGVHHDCGGKRRYDACSRKCHSTPHSGK